MVIVYAIISIERNPHKNIESIKIFFLTNFSIANTASVLEKIKFHSHR